MVVGQGTGIWVQVMLPSDKHVLRDKGTLVNNPTYFTSPLHIYKVRVRMVLPSVAVSRVAASREGLPGVVHTPTVRAV